MILLFTDFGWNGPDVGQMHTILKGALPDTPVIDLMHDAAPFHPRPAAYLLAALSNHWPEKAVVVAVVDPGVGSARKPLAVQIGSQWLVGPDNGLLVPATNALGGGRYFEISWRPSVLSASFHGRDLFAPMAAKLAMGDQSGLSPFPQLPVGHDWPANLGQIIYADHYGNLMTGLEPMPGGILAAGQQQFRQCRTFSEAAVGEAFWYENAMGLTEIAVNRGSAAAILELSVGDTVSWC